MSINQNKINKIMGSLYGFAIGDALGATTEFMDEQEIKQQYGYVQEIIGGGWLNLEPGQCTDDTQMSLCIANVLTKTNNLNDYKKFKKDVAEQFVKWLQTEPKDIGQQCSKAINHYLKYLDYIGIKNQALGNGSLMRALPCAILCSKDADKLNIIQGEITHNNKICTEIILKYSKIVQNYLADKNFFLPQVELLKPTGYIVNTFNNALFWSNKQNFKQCILGAVNHGGDADTIAAITGGIAGAKFGYNNIPQNWINQLDKTVKEQLDKYIKKIIDKDWFKI